MATSGTYTFAPNIDDIMVEAFERVGVSGTPLTEQHARSARRSLQLMLIHWTNIGVPLWQVETVSTTIMQGQQTYTLPAEIADVIEAYVTINGNDRFMGRVSRGDYAAYPNKLVQGPPSQIWVSRVLPAPIVYFYLVPDNTYTFTANCLRQPQDVSALYQTPDAPVLWSEAMAAGLAQRLAAKFAPERLSFLKSDADEAFLAARTENRERSPLTILPDISYI